MSNNSGVIIGVFALVIVLVLVLTVFKPSREHRHHDTIIVKPVIVAPQPMPVEPAPQPQGPPPSHRCPSTWAGETRRMYMLGWEDGCHRRHPIYRGNIHYMRGFNDGVDAAPRFRIGIGIRL